MPPSPIVSFDRLKETDFLNKAETIYARVSTHAMLTQHWPNSIVTLAEVKVRLDTYKEKQLASQSRDMFRIAERQQARERLTEALQQIARFVDLMAQGDASLIASAGFELRRERESGRTAQTPPPAPQKVQVIPTLDNGTLNLRVEKVAGVLAYEVQTTQGDPLAEDAWEHALTMAPATQVRLEGVKPGRTWARLRCVSRGGQGAWTAPVSALVG